MKRLLFLLIVLAWFVQRGEAQPRAVFSYVSSDPSGACSNGTANRYNWTNNKEWGCKNSVWTQVNGGGGGTGCIPAGSAGQVITDDGAGGCTSNSTAAGFLTFMGTPTSANLLSFLTTKTGTGLSVFGTSPLLVTPSVTTINDANGNPFLLSSATASAVDSVTVTNAATANPATVTVGATGSDSNINLSLVGKGTGGVQFPNGLSTGSTPPALTAGTGGAYACAEGTVPSVGQAAGVDVPYCDSTFHGPMLSSNNLGYLPNFDGGVNAQSGTTYTFLLTDVRKLVTFNNASSVAVTLPQATTAGFISRAVIYAFNRGAGAVTITPTTSTINGGSTVTLNQNQGAMIVSDGTNYSAWVSSAPSGSGTVTSAGTSFTGGLITVSGSPVTTSGTAALTVAGTSGGIPYFASSSTWASSAALTASALVLGGGAGAAPTPMGSLGTTTTLLHGNAAGAPTYGAVVSADLNITTSTCTAPQIVTAISATGVATCTAPLLTQNSQSAAYTTVLGDAGKQIYHPGADTTARTWTIDSNANVAYSIGTCITFINDTSAGVVTIAITSDTLVFAGAGTTGSRTLAASNVATACKMTSTRWIISGSSGLT